MCQHHPPCPPADAQDREAAHVVAPHPEQGWSLLCSGVVVFEDTGALLPRWAEHPAAPVGPPEGDCPSGDAVEERYPGIAAHLRACARAGKTSTGC